MTQLPIEIDVNEVASLLAAGEGFLLLDCREPIEYEVARIDGAVLVPMGEIQTRVNEIESERDRRVVVYCHHGRRSLMVANWLRSNGFSGAQSMAGGIDAWSDQIDTTVPKY